MNSRQVERNVIAAVVMSMARLFMKIMLMEKGRVSPRRVAQRVMMTPIRL